jgi:CheY-like chemotaxis protein
MLLAYAGDVRFVLTDVDLNALIAELVRIAAFSVPEHIIIGLELDPTLPALRADFAQTQQLVLNLVTNAIEAIGAEPGSVLVRTRVERLAAPAVAARFAGQALEPGDYAVLEVCDTGCGMTRNTMAHMFEPFFSTKATGHGLGLSMLLGIVKGHRGGVELDSKPGRGTVLRLFLPLPSRVEAANDTANRGARLTVGVTVLLVEDDASVRTVTGRMLQHLGYAVLEATDGQDAIDVLASHAGEVALVIMDVKMPRMDARTALPIINQRWPTLRVLLSSGYASEQNVEDWGGHCVVGFLPKPYRVSALSDALRHAMAAASPV